MHNGFVNFAGEKMSKSLGNFFTIREVTTLYHPEVLRYFLLQVHYRRGVNFDVQVLCPACHEPMSAEAQQALCCEHCGHATTDEGLRTQVKFPGLEETDDRVAYVYETLQAAREIAANVPSGEDTGEVPEPVAGMLHRFTSAMRDDLNTAAALAELSEPLAAVNRLLASTKGVSRSERTRILVRFCRDFAQVATVLGTFERDPTAYLQERRDLKARRLHLDVEYVESLVRARIEARQSKDWDSADAVRDELTALGVKIRDVGSQTVWTL
jgi:cysteinyl-tRNA synthetase